MSIITQRNIASLGTLARLSDQSTATAAGSGDATTVTGLTIDRIGFSNGSMPRSAEIGVVYEATMTSGKTLSIGYAAQHSTNGSTWLDYQTAAPVVVATAGATTVFKSSFNVAVDLNSAHRYIRFNYGPDLSATQLDTFYASAVGFLAGFVRLPAPN